MYVSEVGITFSLDCCLYSLLLEGPRHFYRRSLFYKVLHPLLHLSRNPVSPLICLRLMNWVLSAYDLPKSIAILLHENHCCFLLSYTIREVSTHCILSCSFWLFVNRMTHYNMEANTFYLKQQWSYLLVIVACC